MSDSDFAPTDIRVTRLNETNVHVPIKPWLVVVKKLSITLTRFAKAAAVKWFIKINAIFSDLDFAAGKIYIVPVDVGVNAGLNEEYALATAYLEARVWMSLSLKY